jgi:hypothetical protein
MRPELLQIGDLVYLPRYGNPHSKYCVFMGIELTHSGYSLTKTRKKYVFMYTDGDCIRYSFRWAQTGNLVARIADSVIGEPAK